MAAAAILGEGDIPAAFRLERLPKSGRRRTQFET
jgi:hypothetical protein